MTWAAAENETYCLGFVSVPFYPFFLPTIKAKREKEQHPRPPDNLHCELTSPAPSLIGIRIRLLASFEERVAFLQALRTQGGHTRYHSRWDTTLFWSLLLTRSSHRPKAPPCLLTLCLHRETKQPGRWGLHMKMCLKQHPSDPNTFLRVPMFYLTLNFPCEYGSKSEGSR